MERYGVVATGGLLFWTGKGVLFFDWPQCRDVQLRDEVGQRKTTTPELSFKTVCLFGCKVHELVYVVAGGGGEVCCVLFRESYHCLCHVLGLEFFCLSNTTLKIYYYVF